MFRRVLIVICQKYHEYIHLLFGLFAFFMLAQTASVQFSLLGLFMAVLGSYLPDIDHLIFIFGYGRHSEYAKCVVSYLRQRHLSQAIEHCRINHKQNKFILSHNIFSPCLIFILMLLVANQYLKILLFSMSFHFIFDMLEDILVFGRLNSNWFLKFSRS
jgi:hypothetical protein